MDDLMLSWDRSWGLGRFGCLLLVSSWRSLGRLLLLLLSRLETCPPRRLICRRLLLLLLLLLRLLLVSSLLLMRLEPSPGRCRSRLLNRGGGEELLRRFGSRSRGCGRLS